MRERGVREWKRKMRERSERDRDRCLSVWLSESAYHPELGAADFQKVEDELD